MCRAVRCKTCGKTTWAGCGQHIERVMKDVAASARCRCERGESKTRFAIDAVLALFRPKSP